MVSRRIYFRFDFEKFADTLVYLASHVSDLTPLKATKLIYLIDRRHLHAFARPVIGDFYVAMDHGPVPSKAYDLLNGLRYGTLDEDGNRGAAVKALSERVTVDTRGRYPRFAAVAVETPDHLAPAEIDTIDAVLKKYGRMSASALRSIVHQHAAYSDYEKLGWHQIDYERFFEDAEDPELAARSRELMIQEQEDRDFVSEL